MGKPKTFRHDVFDSFFFAKTKKWWTLEDDMSPLNHITIYDILLISSKIEFVIILYLPVYVYYINDMSLTIINQLTVQEFLRSSNT